MNAQGSISETVSGFRAGSAAGPIGDALAGCMPGEATLTYIEGARADPGHALDWMPGWSMPPRVVWTASGSSGEFDLTDFFAIASGAEADHPFEIAVESTHGLPFVAVHPSGQLQAVRYDAEEGKFKRRILYATASEAVAIQLTTQGADIS